MSNNMDGGTEKFSAQSKSGLSSMALWLMRWAATW